MCFGRRWCALPTVMLGGLMLLTGIWPSARAAAQQPQADGDALLRELAERLLTPPVPVPPGVMLPPVRLLPGALPPDLPVTPPLPPGARLIGSVVRPVLFGKPGVTGPEVGEGIEVVLDVPGTAAAAMSYFTRELAAQGFSPPAALRGFRPGGFLPSAGVSPAAFFCRDERGPYIDLSISVREAQPLDVRVRIQPFPGPCGGPPGPSPVLPPPDPLPPLEPPAGVAVLPTSNGGSSFSRASDAVAETSTSAADLEAHYARQLAVAGWVRTAGGAGGPLAWSVWRVPAEESRPGDPLGAGERQGFLAVLEGPGAGRRSLHLQVVAAGQGAGGPVPVITVPPGAPLPGR